MALSKRCYTKTIYGRIYLRIKDMEVGQTLDKVEFIKKLYGRIDYKDLYYFERSFDVAFINAKKVLSRDLKAQKLPDWKFVSRQKIIERIL